MTDGTKLDAHHRKTVEKLFAHPIGHNIQWHDVLSLLEAVAEVDESHEGRFKITLGPETQTLAAPRGPDIDTQMVVDLRRMLKGAGIGPA
jgi:thiamine biosynthesis lipoprotein ApbE